MSDHHHHHHSGPLEIGTAAKRVVIGLLTGIGVLVLIGAVWMWPSHQHVAIPLPMQNGVGGAMQTESGTVRMQDIGPCGSLSNGKAFDDTPAAPRPNSYNCQRSIVSIDSGPQQGKHTLLEIAPGPGQPDLHAGDHIRLVRQNDPSGVPTYSFDDFSRGLPLTLIVVCFALVIVVVARWRGLRAVLGLGFAFGVLVLFLLPALLDGKPALPVALVAGALILYAVLYLAHGVNLRTSSALLGTLSAMVLAAVLSWVTLKLTHVTGLSEEQNTNVATYLQHVSITGLLLAGFIIGSLGVLNDVTITQASAAFELATLDKAASRREVFAAAMRVGRDHIASTVYTLVLAYAGGALPLLLMFSVAGRSITDVITGDAVAIEITRSAVGGICLALSVPLTTAIAVVLARPFGASPESVAAPRGTARRGRRSVEAEPPRTRGRRAEEPPRRREPQPPTGEHPHDHDHNHEDDDLDRYYADLHEGPGGGRTRRPDGERSADPARRPAGTPGRGMPRSAADSPRSGEIPVDPYRSGEYPAAREQPTARSREQAGAARAREQAAAAARSREQPAAPRTGEQSADPYRSGQYPAAPPQSGPYPGESSRSAQYQADSRRSAQYQADSRRSAQYQAESPRSAQHQADPHRSGQHQADPHRSGQYPVDPYGSGQYPADPYRSGQAPADPYRSGEYPASARRPADPYRSGEQPAATPPPTRQPPAPYGSGEFTAVPPAHGQQPPSRPTGYERREPDAFTDSRPHRFPPEATGGPAYGSGGTPARLGHPQSKAQPPQHFPAGTPAPDAPQSGGFSPWGDPSYPPNTRDTTGYDSGSYELGGYGPTTYNTGAFAATPPRRLGDPDPHSGELSRPQGERPAATGYGGSPADSETRQGRHGRHSSTDDYNF